MTVYVGSKNVFGTHIVHVYPEGIYCDTAVFRDWLKQNLEYPPDRVMRFKNFAHPITGKVSDVYYFLLSSPDDIVIIEMAHG